MERHSAKFECQSCHDKGQAEHQQCLVRCTVLDNLGDVVYVQRAGRAIQHGHAVQQEAGSHRTEDEIFHRRFGGNRGVALQHAQRGEQYQRKKLAGKQSARQQIAARIHQHRHHRYAGEHFKDDGHRIAHEHVIEQMGDPALISQRRNEGADCQREQGQEIGYRLGVVDDELIHDKDHAHHHKQEYLCVGRGQGGEKIHIFLNSELLE